MSVFQLFYEMKLKTSKSWHFEASEDIITKFKSQALHVIRIKYWKAGGNGNPPSLIPALWNIGILLHKQAKRQTIWTRLYINISFISVHQKKRFLFNLWALSIPTFYTRLGLKLRLKMTRTCNHTIFVTLYLFVWHVKSSVIDWLASFFFSSSQSCEALRISLVVKVDWFQNEILVSLNLPKSEPFFDGFLP